MGPGPPKLGGICPSLGPPVGGLTFEGTYGFRGPGGIFGFSNCVPGVDCLAIFVKNPTGFSLYQFLQDQ